MNMEVIIVDKEGFDVFNNKWATDAAVGKRDFTVTLRCLWQCPGFELWYEPLLNFIYSSHLKGREVATPPRLSG